MSLVRRFLLALFTFVSTSSFAKSDRVEIDEARIKEEKSMAPFMRRDTSLPRVSPALPMAPQAGSKRIYKSERSYLGLEFGITSSMQFGGKDFAVAGNYDDGIRNAELDSYAPGISLMTHAVLDLALSRSVGIQAKAGYRHHQSRATGISPAGNVSGNEPQLENDVNFMWDFVAVDALLRLQLGTDSWYALGGLGYSSLLSNYMTGTQAFDNFDGTKQQMTFEGELSDFYNSSRIDAKIGIGTWLPLGEGGLVISPELMIGYPLTSLHTQQTSEAYLAIRREVNNMLYASVGFAIKFPISGYPTAEKVISAPTIASDPRSNTTPEAGKAILSGHVTDRNGELIDDAQVTVVDLNNNEVVATDETDDGIYNVKVNAPGRYSVTADAPGYLFGSTLFEVDKDGRILKNTGDIKLSPSTDGRVRLLVFFDFDKATLQSASYPELNRAVALMKANPNMEVEIAGFTDAQGTDAYNQDLSQRRANTVREYIVRQGVEANRLSAIGYGEANPVSTNDTEDGRAENRRVEFVIKRR